MPKTSYFYSRALNADNEDYVGLESVSQGPRSLSFCASILED